jgi:hypothetical protein
MILIVGRNASETKHAVSRPFCLEVRRRDEQALSALTVEFQEADQ